MISDFVLAEDAIKLDDKLDKGPINSVAKGIYKKTNVQVIVEKRSTDIGEHEYKQLYREIEILASLNHPLVIKFVGFIPPYQESKVISIITEYIENRSLLDVIKLVQRGNKPDWYDGTTKTKIAFGIAVAMSYVHSQNIIHRNLKPANVLLDIEHNPIITGFDIAKFTKPDGKNTVLMGTPLFMAPEMIDSNYDSKSDVYSYSIILYNLLTDNMMPFKGIKDVKQLIIRVKSGERPIFADNVSRTKITDLIRMCWDQQPEKRPTFDDIIRMFKTDEDLVFSGCDLNTFTRYMVMVTTDKYKYYKTS